MAAYTGPEGSGNQEQVWVEAAGHDTGAFASLYNSYFPRIYGYVYHRLGSVLDSEDTVSEIFFKAMNALGRGQFVWKHHASFAVWLFRIAHNAVVSYHRRSGTQSEEVSLDHVGEIQGGSLTPEAALLQKEEFAQLRRLLLTLSPRRQEIITLRFYGGLRNSEIASVLGLDERTVASQICRAIDDLQHRYKHEAWSHETERSK